MNSSHTVSIIVSIYNIEKYIKKCIESIINQSYQSLEIVCINDGSTDNSLEILKKLSLKDNRIKIINQKNQGLSSTRNTGIDNATGKFIYFIDGDDFISKDYINEMVKIITKTNSKIVHNPNYIEYYGNNDVRNQKMRNYQKDAFITNHITHSTWSKMFDFNFLKSTSLKFNTSLLYEDYEFWNKFIAHITINDISLNDKGYYYYRQRPNSIIDNAKNNNAYDNHILKCIESIYMYYSKHKDNLNFKPLYIRLINEHLYYQQKKNRLKFILESRELFKQFDQNFRKNIIMPSCRRAYRKYTSHRVILIIFKALLKK